MREAASKSIGTKAGKFSSCFAGKFSDDDDEKNLPFLNPWRLNDISVITVREIRRCETNMRADLILAFVFFQLFVFPNPGRYCCAQCDARKSLV
mmetsp:Transcript_14346/g.26070  ORF Transcript_14346/g.26070 Transcript_14346/m.26070 type:complete len:94 (-) Transcript_14346:142-423(-)